VDPSSVNGTHFIRPLSINGGVPETASGQMKGTPISRDEHAIERDETPSSDYASLKEAAQTFESLFVLEVLREMEKTLGEGSMFGGSIEGRTYGDLIRWELAKSISSQSSLGIADALVQQLGPLLEESPGKAESVP
jgi:flagellar protein FlgJ